MIMQALLTGLEEARRNWGWFLALGLAMIVLGATALGAVGTTTLASMMIFGWFIVFGGLLEVIASFSARKSSGFLMHLLAGALYAIMGLLIVSHPVTSAAGATLLMAALLLTGGAFRVISAVAMQYPNWGWTVFDGVVSVILGSWIWGQWQTATLWVIGTCVGINLAFRGIAWTMFALSVRRIPPRTEERIRQPQREHVRFPG